MVATAVSARVGLAEYVQFLARPENAGKRFELVRGKVTEMPSPTRFHGTVCFLIAFILGRYIFERKSGSIATNDSGLIVERNPDTVRGPDIMLFLEQQTLDSIPREPTEDVPALVVEVLSPTDRLSRISKRVEQYLSRGIGLVWVIDPEDRTVTIHKPDEFNKVLDESDEIFGNGVLPGFSCRVADFFQLPG